MIQVAYIEDHAGQRESFAALLDCVDDMECAGVFSHTKEALAALSSAASPDVVVIDFHLREETGIHCLEQLRYFFASRPVRYLMLTIDRSSETIFKSFSSGADGYLSKEEASASDVIDAIRLLCQGGSPMSRKVTRTVVTSFRQPPPTATTKLTSLSRRERQLLSLLAEGFSLKECAATTGLSFHTVVSYTKTLYRKLGVRSAREAIRVARF